ncbi:MAG: MFS transporter [Chloroflexi bacterium]|nr:MFS transporter [Chloroflexota bacterium]
MNATGSIPVRPRLSHFRQAMMSLYWFGTSAHWAAILIITLPKQAFLIGGDAVKGQTLGIVLLIGAFVSMVVAPLFGALSDRVITRWGRRRPWIVVGTLMNVVGIFGLIYFPRANDMSSLPLFIVAFMWVELWNNVATAPFSALIPDVVPPDQRGSASGWYGLMSMLGNAVGAVAFTFMFTHNGVTNLTAIYYAVAGALIFGMLGTVLFVKEPPVTQKLPPFRWGEFFRGVMEPLRDHDFRWVFWTRFLMVMGTFTVQEFLQYFMRDVVKDFSLFGKVIASNAETAASFFLAGLLLGAIVSSLLAGVLSDRFGRKFMVYVSSALQAIVPIIFIFFAPFGLVIALGLVFGLGYGAYQAVDWALASDVLPSQEDYAKDMGVWHVAMTFPQVIATPIAGFMLDNFQRAGAQSGAPNLGYTAIFSLAVLYFVLGTVLVRKIRKVR